MKTNKMVQEIYDGTQECLSMMIDYYRKSNDKWIVPFSGSPSSIAMIELLFDMFIEIEPEERDKEVMIVNAQTGIDFPHLSVKMNRILNRVTMFAKQKGYPIQTKVVYPDSKESFWVHILGYGYPPPRSLFQWCANKTKLSPIAHFIMNEVKEESITWLSTEGEEKELLKKHDDFPKTLVFSPMLLMEEEDVDYLLEKSHLSIWGETNQTVLAFYEQVKTAFQTESREGMKDKRGVCGNTLFDYTFACWCCPYKREHESLREFAKNAKEGFWLSPLLRYRGLLLWLSQQNENRMGRENRQRSFYPRRKENPNEMKEYEEEQSETLTLEVRMKLLSELKEIMKHLELEYFIHAPLIRKEEEDEIEKIWKNETQSM